MRVRDQYHLSQATPTPLRQFYTTGDAGAFTALAGRLLPDSPNLATTHVSDTEIDQTNTSI
jgi:hypothetical protein